ncbi:MAG TPA: sulfotransferase [Candidatus Thermoplasmatota archaeon]|nr:sulfotransferase [Candidatus Thermoplasmatota archaeon]
MEYQRLKENTLQVTREPLAGTSLSNLIRLLLENKCDIDVRYLPRLLYAMTVSGLATPLRIEEHLRFDTAIKNTKIEHHPVFILGHWRSGTTYLHNLLSLDATRGYVTTMHALIPEVFLGSERLVNSIVRHSLPEKRPMDEVSMGSALPQEEEYALAALCPYSPNHELCFPRNASFYHRYILMEEVPQRIREAWQAIYRVFLQKETLAWGGRQLVLKNPSNTARVNLLLEMFPDAKFIHIFRNPYHVYRSMMKLVLSIVPYMCLQQPPPVSEVEQQVLQVYKQLYLKYLKDRADIPPENLIEVRYEEFLRQPFDHLKTIYERLHLEGFTGSEQKFRDYIASQQHMTTQRYDLDSFLKERIQKEWDFAFKAFQYEK